MSNVKKATPKGKDKANGNIMSFFKKSEEEAGLFVNEKQGFALAHTDGVEDGAPEQEEHDSDSSAHSRFNETGGSVKRRKTDDVIAAESSSVPLSTPDVNGVIEGQRAQPKRPGPFMEESDSEDGDEQPEALIAVGCEPSEPDQSAQMQVHTVPAQESVKLEFDTAGNGVVVTPEPPKLVKEETSYGPELDDFNDFEGMDDFDEDLFEEGDEYMEQRYMQEQARLEAEEDEKDYDPLPYELDPSSKPREETPICPICSLNLAGVTEQDAGVHVNNCLDGNPTPLPERKKPQPTSTSKVEAPASASGDQFLKPSRAPKPGQASPFAIGQNSTNSGSAFNKLMSGHAEDAAWAEAAASEHASRGKPSYQRTCPFYKILPGLSICVDAFRYGAVQGCQAYFLSHFHSDHYIGLTSHWRHGPIFCSKVTANLVRQQLRVDPKYVVGLDFEKTVEVPGSQGVKVTMISANHCPGSSLFLFEKVVGKKPNGEPRLQRILHCGDFRACREHIQHPLLMPEVRDKLNGRTREQKIDVCYLDTTYLNPKYAFPSQENVIKACADMCVSLSKHSVDESDGWEQMKRQRAGEGMAKFVRKESNQDSKEELSDDVESDDMKLEKNPNGSQQVLSTSNTPNVQQGRGRLLVIVGTYSIGKERICLGIAKALNSKIYAPPAKQRIVAALEDPELNERVTSDPRAAQVHMTPLFEIRADTLDDYLKDYFPHFTRAVGFRPSGWNYRPPNSRFTDSPLVQTVLHSENWKSSYSMKDLVPQRGSTSRASCFGVPYSEHSSFRELTMFCCALRIEKIIPTVNVGSKKSRERMKGWCERWAAERRKNGLYKLSDDGSW
jgi:DNA cross-link repair 1A protein